MPGKAIRLAPRFGVSTPAVFCWISPHPGRATAKAHAATRPNLEIGLTVGRDIEYWKNSKNEINVF